MSQTFGLDLYSNTHFENTRPGIETTLGYGAELVGIIHIDESAVVCNKENVYPVNHKTSFDIFKLSKSNVF